MFDPVQIHKEVYNSGTYNFLGKRIQLPSKINFEKFDSLAKGYWDWQLPILLKFGFPLDFPDEARKFLRTSDVNHASAIENPIDVENYLETERKFSAIMGPYKEPPFGDDTQVSPFMSRPKPDSVNRRIIIALRSLSKPFHQEKYLFKFCI